ncbi:MAG: 1-acyl-sn-glycerol-3-phosphate acyltransferase [Planctomycetes bacterium]|nr:1-acyl-sn-glycerol-3-phosphate acyltransferase [Planctomycetota bacterium]NOG55824.1 1-acyl-sn-glycerol-3-phosphate acyltransferase [Planctomycetota bacterium]
MSLRSRIQQWNPGQPPLSILAYEATRLCAYSVFSWLYDLRIFGADQIPDSGPLLIVSNHQSHLDPPLMTMLSRRHQYFMARSTLFGQPAFAGLIRLMHAIPLDQSRGDTRSFKTALEHLGLGRLICIFPEGSRSESGAVDEFKPGVGLLIKRAKVPVVPVAIEGAFDIWPRTQRLPKLRGRIHMKIGPVVAFDELKAAGARGSLQLLSERIDAMRLQLREGLRHQTRGRYPAPGPGDGPSASVLKGARGSEPAQ